MEAITYKGWTIQEDPENWTDRFIFFPTAEGIQHDAECDENGWHYCGNCKWADSIEDAKDEISEKIMTSLPTWKVETFNPLNGNSNYTKFDWIVDAVKFASQVPGNLLNIESI